MMSSGQIMAQELKLQMGDQLPGALRAMARAAYKLGITQDDSIASMNKAMEQGKLMSEEILPVFANELWEAANQGGALAEAMKSTNAAFGRFQTNVWLANKTFQEAGMDKGIRDLANSASDFINRADELWTLFGKLGPVLLYPFRGLFDLLGPLSDKLGNFSEAAKENESLLKLMGVLVASMFGWSRKLLFVLLLLPGAMSGVGKIIDGEQLTWAEWAVTLAGVALSLAAILKSYKAIQKLRGKGGSPDTPDGKDRSGAGRNRLRVPKILSPKAIAAAAALWAIGKGYNEFKEYNYKSQTGAPLMLKPGYRDGTAITSKEPLIFKNGSLGEDSIFMSGTFSERLSYRLNELGNLFEGFKGYLGSGQTASPEALRMSGMGSDIGMPAMFGPGGSMRSTNVRVDNIQITVDGTGEPDNVAEAIYERFLREASMNETSQES